MIFSLFLVKSVILCDGTCCTTCCATSARKCILNAFGYPTQWFKISWPMSKEPDVFCTNVRFGVAHERDHVLTKIFKCNF